MPTEGLIVERMPEKWQEPVMILAFAGWNDAAESATAAAEFLVQCWSGKRFAYIDAEEFYHFALLRPMVRFKQKTGREREIIWPANHFYQSQASGLPRDVIIGVGVEPHLRWKAYCESVLDLAGQCQVSRIVTLGAFLADVPHTRPTKVSCVTTDVELAGRLQAVFTRYEGPTGIVGVLNDAARRANFSTISLWAQVPHYVSEVRNPHAILALVQRVLDLLDWKADLTILEESAGRFDAQLAEILAQNPNVAQHVKQLEERDREGGKEEEESGEAGLELPSTSELMIEIEQFLRQNRRESGPKGPREGGPGKEKEKEKE
jgi:proteasome assembly chaperone (PAC2) family protein